MLSLFTVALFWLYVAGAFCDGSAPSRKYELKEGGTIVSIVEAKLWFTVAYDVKDEQKKRIAMIPIANDFTVQGAMTADSVTMTILFDSQAFNLTANFEKNKDNEAYINGITFNYEMKSDYFPNATTPDANRTAIWSKAAIDLGPVKKAYICKSEQSFKSDDGDVTLFLSDAKIQVFDLDDGKFSKDSTECAQDNPTTSTPTTAAHPTTTAPTLPVAGAWNVSQDGWLCIIVDAGFRIFYNDSSHPALRHIDVPGMADVNGTCSLNETAQKVDGDQTISLYFGDVSDQWTVTFEFTDQKNKTHMSNGKRFILHEICIDHEDDIHCHDGIGGIYANMNSSFSCNTARNISLDGGWIIEMSDVHLQAYMPNSTEFGSPRSCPPDQKRNDLVPIIVGACLAGLVVIVLIAYLIGRARAKRSAGYENM